MALYGIVGLFLLPALAFAQTGAEEDTWGLDYEGKAIVAVLPFAGEEEDMILRFREETIQAVAGLEKYTPRQVDISSLNAAGVEIPTDMPPNQDLVAGTRYALTGGIYPGSRVEDYYLQLWLWDMDGSTMIYTDDLVYEDMDEAMISLPGLVEWLFSHIYEVSLEEAPAEVFPDHLFMIGLKAGLSPRWYVNPGERSSGAWALTIEGGVSGALRLNSLFALQLEILFTRDTPVYRGLNRGTGSNYILANEKFSSFSLMFPFLVKMNFKQGPFRLSPLAGMYFFVPLGNIRYRMSTEEENQSYTYSISIPAGFTAGFEAAIPYGPGVLFAALRYAGDLGTLTIDDSPQTSYKRQMLSVSLGYEFGFLYPKK
jgi:hypothetical protein